MRFINWTEPQFKITSLFFLLKKKENDYLILLIVKMCST